MKFTFYHKKRKEFIRVKEIYLLGNGEVLFYVESIGGVDTTHPQGDVEMKEEV